MALLAVMLLRSDLRHSKMFSISCAMILGGGVGNLIDRLTYKYVVDFLYFELIDFPIFNFADCCVVVGAILLFVYILFICKESDISSLRGVVFGSKRNKKEQHDDNRDEDLDGSDGCK
jgi:signal peptidase II